MKLSLGRQRVQRVRRILGLIVLGVLSSLIARKALASPRELWSNAQDDALADGDLDAEDIATQSPFTIPAGTRSGRTVLGGPAGSTWLSLLGYTRRTLEDRQEIGGVVLIGLPLDRLARGSTRVTAAVPRPIPELVHTSTTSGSIEGLQRASTTEAPFDLALTPRLARSCVAAAWRAAGLGADDSRLDAIVSRARWSAILPEARLRAVRFEDARLSLDTSAAADAYRLRDSAGANIGFEARFTWRFDRLVYADDEPSLERIRLEQRDARSRVAARVLEALFHWQRAVLDFRTLPPTQQGTRDEADVRLRVMEAEAALDVLTGGWFATHTVARPPSSRSEKRDPAREL